MNQFEKSELRQRFAASLALATGLYANLVESFETDDVLILFDEIEQERRIPVLLLAAVHYLTEQNPDHELARIYAMPTARDAPSRVGAAFIGFCNEFERDIVDLMKSRDVQTNEVNRCAAIVPALATVQHEVRRELALVDIGTSAGLTLLFDRFRYDYANGPTLGNSGSQVRLNCELRGQVPGFDASLPSVGYRVGVDVEPIDVHDPDDIAWLKACVWVGNVGAEQRLDAALDLARREWPDVRRGNVVDLLPVLATEAPDDAELCLLSSFSLLWMSQSDRIRLHEMIVETSNVRPLWWIIYDLPSRIPGCDGSTAPGALALQKYERGSMQSNRLLADVGVHGEWLSWRSTGRTEEH